MKSSVLFAIVSAICSAFLAMPANAQATRTWVSGVGDDANPCSRTAACKTFAGTISKTAAGGEINCLDPGGFGALTITKSISIICQPGTAGVLVSGTNGIVVNGTGAVVYLEGLDFEGIGTGLNGILFSNGTSLYVKDCIIRGFATTGLNFAPSTAGTAYLVVDNTVVTDQLISAAPNGGGILIAPTGGATASAVITNTRMTRNLYGLRVQDNGKASVFGSTASNNTNKGVLAASSSAAAVINVTNSVTANNGTNGIETSGTNALIQMAYVSIFNNTTGINTSTGMVTSFTPGTNANAGNTTAGAPNGAAIPLQ
jgi:hypothetical protein